MPCLVVPMPFAVPDPVAPHPLALNAQGPVYLLPSIPLSLGHWAVVGWGHRELRISTER